MSTDPQGPSYGFDTLQIHAGARPDPATGARQTRSTKQQRMSFAMRITPQLCSTCKKWAISTRA